MATTITSGNATNGAAISSDNTGILQLKTGSGAGTTAVTVDTSQNVGIGTSSPSYKLDVVNSAVNAIFGLRVKTTGTGGEALLDLDSTASNAPAYLRYLANGSELCRINSGGGGEIIFSQGTGPTERMRIDSSGNVGIGISSPATVLDVNGTITSRAVGGGEGGQLNLLNSDNASTGLTVDVATADVGRIFSVRNSFSLQLGQLGGTGGTVTFYTEAQERMRIASDGVITSGLGGMQVISGTAVSASGTAVNFTGLPSWVKKITVMFSGVSTSGGNQPRVQLGTGSTPTYVSSGYAASAGSIGSANTTAITAYTDGFPFSRGAVAADTQSSIMIIANITGTTWVASANTRTSGNTVFYVTSGQVDAGAVVTALRVTINGTDTFDAGTINILYE